MRKNRKKKSSLSKIEGSQYLIMDIALCNKMLLLTTMKPKNNPRMEPKNNPKD